jgi:hypothetical protein
LIAIEKVLISDEVVEEQFVCDLTKCKGGCCEDGDAGAPLDKDELVKLKNVYEAVKPYLTPEGIAEIESRGKYLYEQEFGWVTPTIAGKLCAYGSRDKKGIIRCGIEAAYNDGKTDWKKPISCHLYPIRIKKTKSYEMVNYEPREGLCSPACALGQKLKVPVFAFLKEPLIRKYGEEFYSVIEQVSKEHYERKKDLPVAGK